MNTESQYNSGFDFEEFCSLPNHIKQKSYARKYLKKLGEGTSRVAFLYEDKVLKIAKNKKGIAQNTAEVESPYNQMPLFAHIFKRSEYNEWVLMELCEAVTDEAISNFFECYSCCNDIPKSEIKLYHKEQGFYVMNVANVCFDLDSIQELCFFFCSGDLDNISPYYCSLFRLAGSIAGAIEEETGKPYSTERLTGYNKELVWLLQQLHKWVTEYDPDTAEVGDLNNAPQNWGFTVSREKKKLVIIDYGLNEEVWDKYYER